MHARRTEKNNTLDWLRNWIAFKMATYLRVKPTCALILTCLQIVYAFEIGRRGGLGHKKELEGDILYDDVKERVTKRCHSRWTGAGGSRRRRRRCRRGSAGRAWPRGAPGDLQLQMQPMRENMPFQQQGRQCRPRTRFPTWCCPTWESTSGARPTTTSWIWSWRS